MGYCTQMGGYPCAPYPFRSPFFFHLISSSRIVPLSFLDWCLPELWTITVSTVRKLGIRRGEEATMFSSVQIQHYWSHLVTRQIVGTSSSSAFKSVNALKFLFIFISVYCISPPNTPDILIPKIFITASLNLQRAVFFETCSTSRDGVFQIHRRKRCFVALCCAACFCCAVHFYFDGVC